MGFLFFILCIVFLMSILFIFFVEMLRNWMRCGFFFGFFFFNFNVEEVFKRVVGF